MAWSLEPGRYRGVDRATAQRIRDRDRYTCQRCGGPGHEVDHKVNVKRGGADDDANLWVLCTACHNAKTSAERAAGIALRSRARPPEAHPGRRTPGG